MTLAEKIRYLREVEGSLRGLGRPLTQVELARAIRKEQGKSISQSYDDPEGYHTELTSDLRTVEGKLDVWLLQGSERFAGDRELSEVLMKAARERDTRKTFLLLGAILDTPGLADRLLEALQPNAIGRTSNDTSNGKRGGRR